MADDRAELAAKKAEELDKELDEYIESLKKKSGGKKREATVTEENWQEVGRTERKCDKHVACLNINSLLFIFVCAAHVFDHKLSSNDILTNFKI